MLLAYLWPTPLSFFRIELLTAPTFSNVADGGLNHYANGVVACCILVVRCVLLYGTPLCVNELHHYTSVWRLVVPFAPNTCQKTCVAASCVLGADCVHQASIHVCMCATLLVSLSSLCLNRGVLPCLIQYQAYLFGPRLLRGSALTHVRAKLLYLYSYYVHWTAVRACVCLSPARGYGLTVCGVTTIMWRRCVCLH